MGKGRRVCQACGRGRVQFWTSDVFGLSAFPAEVARGAHCRWRLTARYAADRARGTAQRPSQSVLWAVVPATKGKHAKEG